MGWLLQMNLDYPHSPVMKLIITLHQYVMFYVIEILIIVLYFIYTSINNSLTNELFIEHVKEESEDSQYTKRQRIKAVVGNYLSNFFKKTKLDIKYKKLIENSIIYYFFEKDYQIKKDTINILNILLGKIQSYIIIFFKKTKLDKILDPKHILLKMDVPKQKKLNNLLIVLWYYNNVYSRTRSITHNSYLELVWTIIPSIILCLIAIPSFVLIYASDFNPPYIDLIVKVTGNQWFWHYEIYYNDKNYNFDSYLIPSDSLKFGDLRLLEVDKPLYLPNNTHIKFIVTSSDVIHSFAVPALGIKVDAIPGRLNEVVTILPYKGTYYGQCSELCGINHGFMPINIKVI